MRNNWFYVEILTQLWEDRMNDDTTLAASSKNEDEIEDIELNNLREEYFTTLEKQVDSFAPRNMKIRFKKAFELAELKENESILDLGCGSDLNLVRFFPHIDLDKYLGLDICFGHNLENGLPEFIKTQKVDIIFMLEIIEHIENFKSLLKQCKQMLSDKGRIILSTPNKFRIVSGDILNNIGEDQTHIHCFGKSNMRNLARICGLKITKITGTYFSFPPIVRSIAIPTNRTIYSDVLVYRLEKMRD